MHESSLAFYKLNVTGKEYFYEINEPHFDKVINIIESKSNTERDKIHKVEQMREGRMTASTPFTEDLDMVQGRVFDSSMVIGGKIIMRFVTRWKEEQRKKKQEI